jgi:glycosyltransferase involved in cell wall biosynthesis
MPPLVSILIPCHNARQWVKQAIDSSLAQTWEEKEIIVIDDGSTDGSLKIIEQFDGRIRWETGPNRGGNAARNRLLELAKGVWLQYLDADDYLLPDKIANQMRFIGPYTDADIVYGPVTKEFHTGDRIYREFQPIPEPHDLWQLLVLWYLPQTGAPLWRKQALLEVGGWKAEQPCCQEHELYLRLLMAGKTFSYSAHGGAIYRQWSDQTVCKRDKPQVIRHRLEITQRAEDFLNKSRELTNNRRQAINQARFQMARLAWGVDRSTALQTLRTIQISQPGFSPDAGTLSRSYRTSLSLLGFRATETFAGWRRLLQVAAGR